MMKLAATALWLILLHGAEVVSGADGSTVGDFAFQYVSRHYIPAGYQTGTSSGVPNLVGFGFGALERSYYDANTKLLYGGSELGFVTVTDFVDYPDVVVTDIGIQFEDTLTDVKVCGDYLFVSTKDDPSPGTLHIYKAAKRGDNGSLEPPALLQTVEVGVGPDNILVSKDCMLVATADEAEGDYGTMLINPRGTVTILRGPFDETPEKKIVSLGMWSEEVLLEKGVHLPLSRNALIYWDSVLDVDFTSAIENYTPDAGLEPEYLAFSADESKILVNLQENNALVVIDVESSMATDIFPYGLKSGFPVDVVKDDGCENMPTVDGLHFLRSADSIASFAIDGETYVITANEGDDVEYGDFEEKVKAKDIFDGDTILLANMTVDATVMKQAKYFNAACNDTVEEFCASGLRLTVGTSMIDYSDPKAPNINRIVGFGGRGITIYKLTESGLEMTWDSGDQFEREGCAAFPWAHNGVQDEEFASVDGAMYDNLDPVGDSGLRETIEELNDPTVDGCDDRGDGLPGACPLGQTVDERSEKDGYAAETVVVGYACGKLHAVTVSEKNSVGFLYQIVDVTAPVLVDVFHLSSISETLSPDLAYDQGLLGEIDSETIQFLEADKSPTGKPAVIFSGAWSGSASLWEFECLGEVDTEAPTKSPTEDKESGAVSHVSFRSIAPIIMLVMAVSFI